MDLGSRVNYTGSPGIFLPDSLSRYSYSTGVVGYSRSEIVCIADFTVVSSPNHPSIWDEGVEGLSEEEVAELFEDQTFNHGTL